MIQTNGHPLLTDMLQAAEKQIQESQYHPAAVELRKIGEHMVNRMLIDGGLWEEACTNENGMRKQPPSFGWGINLLGKHKLIDHQDQNEVFRMLQKYGNHGAHATDPIEEYEIRFVYEKTKQYVTGFLERFPDAARHGILPTPGKPAVPGSAPAEKFSEPVPTAQKAGEIAGFVLYSDVVAMIDGRPIRSFNIAGDTYVIADVLEMYGFSVKRLLPDGRLVIDPAHKGMPETYATTYSPVKNTHAAGEAAMPYYASGITTWIGSQQIPNFRIDGFVCIRMDDLANAFAEYPEDYVWDTETITLRLTTRKQ